MKRTVYPAPISKRSVALESNPETQLDKLDDENQAAEFLNLSVATLRRRRLLRQLPIYIKLGARVLYRRCDLLSFVESGARLPE